VERGLTAPRLQEEEEEPLPTLVAFDSIDLQILENLQDQQTESLSSVIPHPPLLLKDPLDPTSIYVQHALGVHWISIRPFVTALAQALTIQDVEQEAMEMVQLWKRKVKCLSDWAIDTWTGQNG
jgi:nucleoporin NUP82